MIRKQCFYRLCEGWAAPTPKEVAEYLSEHGLSDAAAARLIGVSKMKPGRWRRGEAVVSYADWRALVWELG